ncbi:MAG: hypothetical protein GXP36_12845 [Actinobacteria bacterium]|nr:hypothetical protein [Actinomycetota bacterium]
MSVGHVAREIEAAGIPTVSVYVQAFRHVSEAMGVPRTVVTRHPMGRTLGAPGDVERQHEVIGAALDLLESAQAGGALVELEAPYRPGSLSG